MKRCRWKKTAAFAMALALAASSAAAPMQLVYADEESAGIDETLTVPFGLEARVQGDKQDAIGSVWGAAGYELYTVTIKCEANGYEKVYEDQNLAYHVYEDDYDPGEYTVSVQGQMDGKLSPASTVTLTISGAEAETDDKENPVSPESPEDTDDDNSITDEGLDFSKMDHSVDFIEGGTDVTVSYEGTKIVVSGSDWGNDWADSSHWQIQLKEIVDTLDNGVYDVSFTIKSDVSREIFIKLGDLHNDGTVYAEETINLAGGETQRFTITTDKEVDISDMMVLFALGTKWGSSENTIVISNVEVKCQGGTGSGTVTEKGLEYDFSADNSAYDFADPGAVKEGYDLIWADEFDGNYENAKVDEATGLNLNNWAYQLGDGSTDCGNYGWGNNELQCYTGNVENVGVNEDLDGDGEAEGLLRITAAYEENGYNYAGESAKRYTSARLRTTTATEPLFDTTYGYVEARISLPQTQGAWPAFWMLPQSTEIYGGWPVSGEIDILETTGTQTNQACSTVHWGVPAHVYKGSGYTGLNSDIRYFHTYAVDWKPGQMDFLYDGEVIYTSQNWESALPGASDSLSFDAPFDMPFYMILNLAVDSGQFGGSANKANFKDDINMYVDYVRVFQKSEGYPASVDKSASEGTAQNWAEFNGINQIADITENNLDVNGGGHNDSAASGSGKWYLSNQDNASANASVVVKEGTPWAKVNVTGAGNQDYGVQLIGHYNAKKGYVYKVSFDAYAEGDLVGKTVNCDSKEYQGWSTYGVKQFTLKNEAEHTEYIFEQTEDFDNCRIEFNIGGMGTGTVYVSNVKVEIVDPASLGNTSSDGTHGVMPNGNMIFNGSFDQGSNHLGYWKATEGTDCIVPRYTNTALAAGDKKVKDVASLTNYEKLSDGIKYYERRAQISGSENTAPQIYQPGIKMTADSYTVKFDLYSKEDTAVKATVCTLKFDGEGNVVGVDRELASAKASYNSGDGVKNFTLSLTTKEDVANGALVLTFAKGSSVYLDNVTMTGANQAAGFDENPMDGNVTWEGHDATDQPFVIKDNGNGCFTAENLTSGGAWYQPQIGSSNFETVSGVKYDLSFKFRLEGDSNKSFEYIVQEAGGSWTVVKDVTKVDFSEMTEDAEGFFTYTTQFTATASLSDCHFVFGFGNSAVKNSAFTFKDVKLTAAKAEAGDAGAFDNDETIADELFGEKKAESDGPSSGTGSTQGTASNAASGASGSDAGQTSDETYTAPVNTLLQQAVTTNNTQRRTTAGTQQTQTVEETPAQDAAEATEEIQEEAVAETVETAAAATVIEDAQMPLAAEEIKSETSSPAKPVAAVAGAAVLVAGVGVGGYAFVKKRR